MSDQLEDIGAMLRESAVDFFGRKAARKTDRAGLLRARDRQVWLEMAELGWLGLAASEANGGAGQGVRAAGVLSEVFGEHVSAEPFIEGALAPSILLSLATSQTSAAHLCGEIARGERMVGIAWQERGDELDITDQCETRVAGGRLDGYKRFVPAVEDEGVLLVLARTESELAIVLVPVQAPGVHVERRATALGHLSAVRFDRAPVISELLHGMPARRALRVALDASLIAAAALLSGIAAGALSRTVDYVNQRRQFGQPIGAFQSIQHRCADLYVGLQLAGAAWRRAAKLHDESPGDLANAAAISAAKARASDVALAVGRAAIQMHGAIGFTEESDIGLYLRAAMQYSAWLGGAVAHRRRFLAHQPKEHSHG